MVSAMGDADGWQLFDRLREMCFDVYVAGDFATLRERLGHVIAANNLRHAIAGHHRGKRETYARAFERIYGIPLPDAPRETNSNARRKT
jgi:hypothetical protein